MNNLHPLFASILARHKYRDRFDAMVHMCPMSGCWLWTGRVELGYGLFPIDGKRRQAHRIAWELYRGPIPNGMSICHRCDVPSCVNPAHLFVGTQADNNADMWKKGRAHKLPDSKGRGNGRALLTEEMVREIRDAPWHYGTRKALSIKFGVGPLAIYNARTGRRWGHL